MRQGLISATEIAEQLGIQCQTVYLWVRQRRIPFYRVGRLVKFDKAEVLARFKADAEQQKSSDESAPKQITISRNAVIDPRRALGSHSSQATEQSERYRALLGMVK
ncbi:MAG: excisionase family DNA-binding protein [Acidobacteriota bacterium]|nr:excisionase family DNA-binding protein [Acidobacteriota bacterium]